MSISGGAQCHPEAGVPLGPTLQEVNTQPLIREFREWSASYILLWFLPKHRHLGTAFFKTTGSSVSLGHTGPSSLLSAVPGRVAPTLYYRKTLSWWSRERSDSLLQVNLVLKKLCFFYHFNGNS